MRTTKKANKEFEERKGIFLPDEEINKKSDGQERR
jgi:hypothetical protein